MLCLVINLGREQVEGVQFTPSCAVETPSQFTSKPFREEACSRVGEVWTGKWRELESKSKDIWQELVEIRTGNPLGYNGVDFRNHMENTDDPGRKDHQELDLGRWKKPKAVP